MLKTFLGLAGVVASLLGMIAAAIIVVIAATSGKFLRRRLSYEAWHAIHMAVYVAIFVALVAPVPRRHHVRPARGRGPTGGRCGRW